MTDTEEIDIDENEFWKDSSLAPIESLESPLKQESEPFKSEILCDSPRKYLFRTFTWKVDEAFTEKLKTSVKEVREHYRKEEEEITKDVRAKTRKELREAVREINEQFEEEIHVIRAEHNKMKDEINKRDKEIKVLGQFMSDQEVLISNNRLLSNFSAEDPPPSPATVAEKKELKRELKIVQVQIEGLKDAALNYLNDTIRAGNKMKDLDKAIADLKNKNNEELKQLEENLKKRIVKATEERDEVRRKFEEYKKNGWTEIESKGDSLQGKKNLIATLQDELKLAKKILYDPRVNLRVYNTLKEYANDYENDELQTENAVENSLPQTSVQSKNFEVKRRFKFIGKFDLGSRFNSIYSDTTNSSKFNTKRSSVTNGRRTRLSPL